MTEQRGVLGRKKGQGGGGGGGGGEADFRGGGGGKVLYATQKTRRYKTSDTASSCLLEPHLRPLTLHR